ncbi:hypothetical protein SAMN05216383_11413 [Prevotella sp. KH2C16]|nr:hypothetical protein SAMN05216383_11413 [Prevotella sp. KH2C16]
MHTPLGDYAIYRVQYTLKRYLEMSNPIGGYAIVRNAFPSPNLGVSSLPRCGEEGKNRR